MGVSPLSRDGTWHTWADADRVLSLAPSALPSFRTSPRCLSPFTSNNQIHDGLFIHERRRAGAHVQNHREEAGQPSKSTPASPGTAETLRCCVSLDAGLSAHVLQPRRAVLQLLLQRLHEQGLVLEGGALPVPFSASASERSQEAVQRTDDLSPGAMRPQLHRQVPEAFGASGSAVRRTKCRCVRWRSRANVAG